MKQAAAYSVRVGNATRFLSLFALGAIAICAISQNAAAQTPLVKTATFCATEGDVRLLCGLSSPEDLFVVPGTDWVVASALRAGGLHIINVRDKSTAELYPTQAPKERFDQKTYATCPSALDAEAKARFSTAGVFVNPVRNGLSTVYAVFLGKRTSVEVFELDMRGKTPSATWVGCVVAPDGVNLNSVVALPEGGFIATSFNPPGTDATAARARLEAGNINAEVWEWHAGKGWARVPGSEASGPNGVEISKDGKWIYFSAWGSQTFVRLSRGTNPPKRDNIPLGFRPDNIHWAPDGTLLGSGATEPSGTKVVKIDPATLKVTTLFEKLDTPGFVRGTAAIQVGSEIWVGTARADHIAVFTVPK